MVPGELDFLKALLTSPGPSGYEQPIQQVVRQFAGEFADEVRTDWHGNVIAAINPGGYPRIMLAGHCDQIGLMVQNISDQGYLYALPIGGWDVQMLIGQNMVVWTQTGPIPGVIARKAIHLLTAEERKTVPEVKDLWIDIGVNSKEEAQHLVKIGDPVTFKLGFEQLQGNLAAAPGMDDRVGVWVVMNALKRLRHAQPEAAVFAVSTVQEEIGLRGAQTSAFSLDPQLGIAVDVTHATDTPTIDQNQHGVVKVDGGPVLYRGPNVNPAVYDELVSLAEKNDIPIQIKGLSRGAGNDGNIMQISRGGMAVGLVAIPNRYMHSPVEVVSLRDLDQSASLIAHFCAQVRRDSDYTPR